jgi:phage tail tape-measure protein
MTAAFLFLTAAGASPVAGASATSTVTVPLQRRQRWMEADRWGRRQSTTEPIGLRRSAKKYGRFWRFVQRRILGDFVGAKQQMIINNMEYLSRICGNFAGKHRFL